MNSLEGKYVDEILPDLTRFIERNKAVREPRLSPFQEQIKSVLGRTNDGELWSGNESTATGVKLGHGVMFEQTFKDGHKVFVLEQADRAVYLLKNQQDAEKIATGQWLRTDARKAGNSFVVHAGDWQTKLEQRLRSMAEELKH